MHVALSRVPSELHPVAPPPEGDSGVQRMVVAGVLAMHAALAWLLRPPGVETGQDDAVYLLLARSLRELAYRDLHLTGTPPHGLYPPGYPALLSWWGAVAGQSFDALSLLGIGASTAALGVAWLLTRMLLAPPLALFLLAALAVNPYLVTKAGEIASEAPYMLLSLLTLWVLAERKVPSGPLLALAGALALGSALTRAVGVALLGALGVHWALERRWREVGPLVVGAGLAVGGWLWWAAAVPNKAAGKSYLMDAAYRDEGPGPSWFGEVLLDRALHNVPRYLTVSLPYRLPVPTVPGTPVDNVLGSLIVAGGLVVGVAVLWRRWRLAALYLIAYGGLLAVWPWQVGRFLIPVLPLLVPAIALGVGSIAGAVRPGWSTPAVALLGLLLFVGGSARTGREAWLRRGCERGPDLPAASCVTPDQASFFAALRYIRRAVEPDAVFLSAKPEPLFYYTGRRSIPLDGAMLTSEGLLPGLRARGVDYVLLGSLQAGEVGRMAAALEANCSAIQPEAFFPPRTYLFRVGGTVPGSAPRGGCEAVAEYRRLNAGRNFALSQ